MKKDTPYTPAKEAICATVSEEYCEYPRIPQGEERNDI
jgi:hypothetical protein